MRTVDRVNIFASRRRGKYRRGQLCAPRATSRDISAEIHEPEVNIIIVLVLEKCAAKASCPCCTSVRNCSACTLSVVAEMP